MIINGYQSVINSNHWLFVINKLSIVINDYQGLLMVISKLSIVINGNWLLTSYQWLSMVIKGY